MYNERESMTDVDTVPGPPGSKTAREPAVPNALNLLSKEIQHQASVLDQLESRLESVIRQEAEKPDGKVLEAGDMNGLMGNIHALRRQVSANTRRITRIIHLLEL